VASKAVTAPTAVASKPVVKRATPARARAKSA
jgi:hypothetical protein